MLGQFVFQTLQTNTFCQCKNLYQSEDKENRDYEITRQKAAVSKCKYCSEFCLVAELPILAENSRNYKEETKLMKAWMPEVMSDHKLGTENKYSLVVPYCQKTTDFRHPEFILLTVFYNGNVCN